MEGPPKENRRTKKKCTQCNCAWSTSVLETRHKVSEGFRATYPPNLVRRSNIKRSTRTLYFGCVEVQAPTTYLTPSSALHATMTTALYSSFLGCMFLCILSLCSSELCLDWEHSRDHQLISQCFTCVVSRQREATTGKTSAAMLTAVGKP